MNTRTYASNDTRNCSLIFCVAIGFCAMKSGYSSLSLYFPRCEGRTYREQDLIKIGSRLCWAPRSHTVKNLAEVLNRRPGRNACNSVDQSRHYLLSMEFNQSICFSREVPVAESISHESQLQVVLVWGHFMNPTQDTY
jgi:hypothetical protein